MNKVDDQDSCNPSLGPRTEQSVRSSRIRSRYADIVRPAYLDGEKCLPSHLLASNVCVLEERTMGKRRAVSKQKHGPSLNSTTGDGKGGKVKNKAQRVGTRVDQKNLEHEMEKASKPIRMLDAAAAASVRPAAHGFGPFRWFRHGPCDELADLLCWFGVWRNAGDPSSGRRAHLPINSFLCPLFFLEKKRRGGQQKGEAAVSKAAAL